jgi:hypothetical protein
MLAEYVVSDGIAELVENDAVDGLQIAARGYGPIRPVCSRESRRGSAADRSPPGRPGLVVYWLLTPSPNTMQHCTSHVAKIVTHIEPAAMVNRR